MSFLAKLDIEGKIYNILESDYTFHQRIDTTGKPQGMTQGGEIILRLESTGNTELLQWMLDHNQTKNGKIIFYRRDAMSKMQELIFEKAYCIDFKEHFDASNTEPLQITLKLIARRFMLNDVVYEKKWKI